MSEWQIHATLDDGGDGYRLGMVATRTVDGKAETTSDSTMVSHPAEARLECARFAKMLGVKDYALEDRRGAAA